MCVDRCCNDIFLSFSVYISAHFAQSLGSASKDLLNSKRLLPHSKTKPLLKNYSYNMHWSSTGCSAADPGGSKIYSQVPPTEDVPLSTRKCPNQRWFSKSTSEDLNCRGGNVAGYRDTLCHTAFQSQFKLSPPYDQAIRLVCVTVHGITEIRTRKDPSSSSCPSHCNAGLSLAVCVDILFYNN